MARSNVLSGVAIYLARVWPGADRAFERALKRRNNLKGVCPRCRANYLRRAAARMRRARARSAS